MIECPVCGHSAIMGLPQDATVESVTSVRDDAGATSPGKVRSIRCANDHSIRVGFSYQREIDPLLRDLQTW